jgi:hypothetical protein
MPEDLGASTVPDDRFENVLAEILLEEEAGRPLDLSRIVQTYPDLETPLREFFRDRDGFDRLFSCRPAAPTPTTPPGPPPDLAAGSRFAGYEILGELGRGGMGVVYKARHVGLNRLVALKMILAGGHAGPDDLARFRGEAEAVARLKHANVVQIYDFGEAGGLPYFSLEFVEGGGLDKKLAGTPLLPTEAAALVETLAQAMAAAHAAGLVHRDLKPANVLLAADGTPKVTDFGLVKRLDVAGPGQPAAAGLTASGAILGTPSYMAPEQAGGRSKEIGPACDIYALGAILYECLTGRPPFKAATPLDTILQVIADEPAPPRQLNARVPVALETICQKCLMKDPRRRYATAHELAEDLRRYAEGRPIRARPVGTVERALKWLKRRPAAASALVGGVLLIFGASAFLAAGWASTMRAGEKAARDELDRYRAQVENEREQRRQEEDDQKRSQQMAEARRQASRQLAKVAVLWDKYPEEALRLLEDTRAFPPEVHETAWEGYHRLCRVDRQKLQGDGPPITAMQVTADLKMLMTQDADDTVRLWGWDRGTLNEQHTLRLPAQFMHVQVPDKMGGMEVTKRRVPRTVSVSANGPLLAYNTMMSLCLTDLEFIVLGSSSPGSYHLPPEVLAKLKVLKGKVFDSPEQLSSELTEILDKEESSRFREVVVKVATAPNQKLEFHDFKSNTDHAIGYQQPPVFAPDGKTFALQTGNGSVALCNAATWSSYDGIRPKASLTSLYSLTFAPNGKTLALVSSSRGRVDCVQIWDLEDLHLRAEFVGPLFDDPVLLAFSPDGMFLAARHDVQPDRSGKPQPPKVVVWEVPPEGQGQGHRSATQDMTEEVQGRAPPLPARSPRRH